MCIDYGVKCEFAIPPLILLIGIFKDSEAVSSLLFFQLVAFVLFFCSSFDSFSDWEDVSPL